jgi:hypothetical protein
VRQQRSAHTYSADRIGLSKSALAKEVRASSGVSVSNTAISLRAFSESGGN